SIEGCWLVLVTLTPVFFNVASGRGFEPDKLALVRLLALVMGAAWLVKLLDGRKDRAATAAELSLFRHPLMWAAGALAVAYLVSTVFSLLPAISWWGSYTRLQGTYTTLSYMLIFAAVAAHLRRREQVDRLLDAISAAGFAVALYGILQHFGADPLPWGSGAIGRSASTAGNAVFMAGYLGMVVPLSIYRAYGCWFSGGLYAGPWHWLRRGVWLAVVVSEVLAMVFSLSRGPELGLVAGLASWAVVELSRHRPSWRGAISGAIALPLLLAALLNVPRGPLQAATDLPGIRLVSQFVESRGQSVSIRVELWKSVVAAMAPHDPIRTPQGQDDRFNSIRLIVGYGPEVTYEALARFLPEELLHLDPEQWDRPHNETLGSLISTGMLGALACLGLFASAFYWAFEWLGFVQSNHRWLYWCTVTLGVAGGGVVAVLGAGAPYVGMGLSGGLLAAAIAWPLLAGGRERIKGAGLQPGLLAALVAVLVMHFAETQFNFVISTTGLQFWVSLGLLLAVCSGRIEDDVIALPSSPARSTRVSGRSRFRGRGVDRAGPILYSPVLVCTVVLIALAYDFGRFRPGVIVLTLFIPSLLVAGILLGDDHRAAVMSWSIAGLSTLLFGLYELVALNGLIAGPGGDLSATVTSLLINTGMYCGLGVAALLLVAFTSGWTLSGSRIWSHGLRLTPAAMVLVVAVVTGFYWNIRPVQADMLNKIAGSAAADQEWDLALALGRESVMRSPGEAEFYTQMGSNDVLAAGAATDPAVQNHLMESALEALTTAERIDPLEPLHIDNVAKFWQHSSVLQPNDPRTEERIQTATADFDAALALSPYGPGLEKDRQQFREMLSLVLGRDEVAP